MKELTYVANKYSTDKGTEIYHGDPTLKGDHGVNCRHGYTEFYDSYFAKFKETRPVILEIGVAEGGSVRMLNDYYHGNCEIYCIDIQEKWSKIEELGDNIHFILGDQSNAEFLKNFTYFLNTNNIMFDFIIDDGSHVVDHMMLSYNYLYSYVKPTGFYIIEDINTTYDPAYNPAVENDEYNPILFFTQLKNFHIFVPEVNEKLHKSIKSTILFTNRNTFISHSYETEMSMTMLIFLNNE